MGVHRGARDRCLPGRWCDSCRAGGTPSHGSVRDPGPPVVAAGRQGPQGARTDPGLRAAWCRHRCSCGRRGRGRTVADRVCAGGVVDHRCHPLPTGALRIAPVALPHRIRARQRQCGPWAAGRRRHLGGSAAGSVAAAVRRRDRRIRCGCGRLVVGCSLAVAAELRRTSAAIRPERYQPGELGRRRHSSRQPGTATLHSSWALQRRSHSPEGR